MLGFGHKHAGVSIEQTGVHYIYFKNKNPKQVPGKKFLPLPAGLIVENQVADKEALTAELKSWVKREGLRGGTVDLSIPPSQMIIRKMTIPAIVDKQIDQLVKLEVETSLHLPFENPVYDYVITGQTEEESQIILLAAPRKVVQDYVDVLEEAGFKIRSVEVTATALARSIMTSYNHSFDETMLIHLEQSLVDIDMFRSGHLVFMRTLDLIELDHGKPQLAEASLPLLSESQAAATSEDHLTPEQIVEITAEISRMLSFYQYSLHDGSTRITEVLITGTPELRHQLQEELLTALPELAITSLNIDQLAGGVKVSYNLNDYRVAAGAALKGKGRGPDTMDLLPREDRETVIFPYIAGALAVVWVLGFIGSGFLNSSLHGEIRDQADKIGTLQDHNTELQLQLAELNKQQSGMANLDRQGIITILSGQRADAAAVLDELKSRLPAGAVIRDINYTFHGDLMLTVDFTAMEDSASYLTALRGMSFAVSAAITKLTEGSAQTSAALITNVSSYSAVYQVSMNAPAVAQNQQTADGEGESNGTGQ
ncbi:pilus assembly protein PilM [Paenibacillus pinistramenti]|uniref:pilus assembly protein PilM n=1 Tax=Paenibacillus pinistramenti TaxID=1768003 RepID=UPI001109080D|nr:pilus assembly protein PilM [Paenibacillus pinistramenti]